MVNENLDARRLSVQSCSQTGIEVIVEKATMPQVERLRRK